ncbi:hypothetical protein HanPI659440_Chr08g0297541 [Helianthus annuus]|nr:hypothetical protein HanPI659440_Chr08g0297541 [Helianthus annuus]
MTINRFGSQPAALIDSFHLSAINLTASLFSFNIGQNTCTFTPPLPLPTTNILHLSSTAKTHFESRLYKSPNTSETAGFSPKWSASKFELVTPKASARTFLRSTFAHSSSHMSFLCPSGIFLPFDSTG